MPAAELRPITILTYNVGNGLAKPERLAAFLRESDADVIGLQEIDAAQAAEGPDALQLRSLRVVATLGSGRERVGGLLPALEVLERDPPVVVREAVVAGLPEVIERLLVPAEKAIGDAKAQVRRGLQLALLAVGDGLHRVAEDHVAGRIADRDSEPLERSA